MDRSLFSRLLMVGPREGRGAIAGAVEAYRAQGVFRRWPVEYVAPGPRALHSLGTILARQGRAVLHVHLCTARDFWASVPLMGLALASRCPLLVQLHGGQLRVFDDAGSGATASLLRYFLERAAAVLVPCEALRLRVHALARRAEIGCLPPAVAIEDIARPAPEDPARQHVVLFLGRLEAENGVFDLVDAVAALRADVPDVRLVCAGEGRARALLKYARHLGVAEHLRLTGWVGPSGKRALFETAAVYARPAYDDGLPVSLLEAMGAGVPVVASMVGGIPEAVVDGVNGYLTPAGDTASLTRRLRKVLKQPLAGARLGKAGRESVRLRFAPERMVARLEELYASIGLTARASEPQADDAHRAARMSKAA
jgi:glycosyltransferase involved in cell wall biosynthesis